MLTISTGSPDLGKLRTPAVAFLLEQSSEPPELGSWDGTISSAIRRVTANRDFRAAKDEALHLLGTEGGIERVLLIGMGKVADRLASLKRAAAIASRRAHQAGFGRLAIHAGSVSSDEAEAIAVGAIAGAWEFKEMQAPLPAEERRAPLTEVVL